MKQSLFAENFLETISDSSLLWSADPKSVPRLLRSKNEKDIFSRFRVRRENDCTEFQWTEYPNPSSGPVSALCVYDVEHEANGNSQFKSEFMGDKAYQSRKQLYPTDHEMSVH